MKVLSETDSSTFAFTFTNTHNGHTSFSGDLNALFTCMSYEKYFEIAYISLTWVVWAAYQFVVVFEWCNIFILKHFKI